MSGERSNNHRLVRVLKYPDSSVSRVGRCNKPLDDCSFVDGSSELRENTFSLEDFGVQPDSQTSASFALSQKNVFLQMRCKAEDTKELANEVNKQFDPGG